MRRWQFTEPVEMPGGHLDVRVVTLTENEILEQHYVKWARQAIRFHLEHPHRSFPITPETCIEDWVIIHWAHQVKP